MRIVFSHNALRDLDEIWTFIASDRISAADKMQEEIEQRANALAKMPYMGIERPELQDDLRSISQPPYIIYYRVRKTENVLQILRIIHGSRDINQETFE